MIDWVSLAKYVIFITVTSLVVYQVYDSGKQAERAKCLQLQKDFSDRAEELRQKQTARRIEEKRVYETNLMRLINEKQKLQADLNQRMHELTTGGLWIDAKACSSRDSLPGKTKNSSIDDRTAGPEKIRLPGKTERSLLAIGYDAAELVDKYNDLRELCLPLVEVVD